MRYGKILVEVKRAALMSYGLVGGGTMRENCVVERAVYSEIRLKGQFTVEDSKPYVGIRIIMHGAVNRISDDSV